MQARRSGRLQLALIAAVFFGPLLLAAWLYFGGQAMQPRGRTNHGTLLVPIISLGDELPGSPIHRHTGESWLLVYARDGSCDAPCRDALYTFRQARLMLGRDMSRLRRIFLHGDTPPDKVFLATEHEGLITLSDDRLSGLLDNKKPVELPAGGYYLIDPLGNLVMYFQPDIEPDAMVDDIEHLLELSRIG